MYDTRLLHLMRIICKRYLLIIAGKKNGKEKYQKLVFTNLVKWFYPKDETAFYKRIFTSNS